MKNKIIGIPGWSTGDNSWGVTKNYLQWISHFGIPRIITPDEDVVDVDLLVLPGGLDVDASTYGMAPSFQNSSIDAFKHYFVQTMLPKYIEKGIGIVGICLGMQQLAVHFGSKMTQHLIYHEQSKDRWTTAHYAYSNANILNLPDKPTKDIPGFKVNSHHHQCITVNNLGEELNPLLVATNNDAAVLRTGDGHIVEAFVHKNLPIVGLQWHPEELYDHYSTKMVNNLLDN